MPSPATDADSPHRDKVIETPFSLQHSREDRRTTVWQVGSVGADAKLPPNLPIPSGYRATSRNIRNSKPQQEVLMETATDEHDGTGVTCTVTFEEGQHYTGSTPTAAFVNAALAQGKTAHINGLEAFGLASPTVQAKLQQDRTATQPHQQAETTAAAQDVSVTAGAFKAEPPLPLPSLQNLAAPQQSSPGIPGRGMLDGLFMPPSAQWLQQCGPNDSALPTNAARLLRQQQQQQPVRLQTTGPNVLLLHQQQQQQQPSPPASHRTSPTAVTTGVPKGSPNDQPASEPVARSRAQTATSSPSVAAPHLHQVEAAFHGQHDTAGAVPSQSFGLPSATAASLLPLPGLTSQAFGIGGFPVASYPSIPGLSPFAAVRQAMAAAAIASNGSLAAALQLQQLAAPSWTDSTGFAHVSASDGCKGPDLSPQAPSTPNLAALRAGPNSAFRPTSWVALYALSSNVRPASYVIGSRAEMSRPEVQRPRAKSLHEASSAAQTASRANASLCSQPRIPSPAKSDGPSTTQSPLAAAMAAAAATAAPMERMNTQDLAVAKGLGAEQDWRLPEKPPPPSKQAGVRAPRAVAKGWTAFTTFGLQMREKVRSANPNASAVEIEKLVGALWGRLSAEEKQQWVHRAIRARSNCSNSSSAKRKRATPAARQTAAGASSPRGSAETENSAELGAPAASRRKRSARPRRAPLMSEQVQGPGSSAGTPELQLPPKKRGSSRSPMASPQADVQSGFASPFKPYREGKHSRPSVAFSVLANASSSKNPMAAETTAAETATQLELEAGTVEVLAGMKAAADKSHEERASSTELAAVSVF